MQFADVVVQLFVPLPPFFGAMRSSSFSIRKRLSGAGASAASRGAGSVVPFLDFVVLLTAVLPRSFDSIRRPRRRLREDAIAPRGRTKLGAAPGGLGRCGQELDPKSAAG